MEDAGEERLHGSRGEGEGFPKAMIPNTKDVDGDDVVCEQQPKSQEKVKRDQADRLERRRAPLTLNLYLIISSLTPNFWAADSTSTLNAASL